MDLFSLWRKLVAREIGLDGLGSVDFGFETLPSFKTLAFLFEILFSVAVSQSLILPVSRGLKTADFSLDSDSEPDIWF